MTPRSCPNAGSTWTFNAIVPGVAPLRSSGTATSEQRSPAVGPQGVPATRTIRLVEKGRDERGVAMTPASVRAIVGDGRSGVATRDAAAWGTGAADTGW